MGFDLIFFIRRNKDEIIVAIQKAKMDGIFSVFMVLVRQVGCVGLVIGFSCSGEMKVDFLVRGEQGLSAFLIIFMFTDLLMITYRNF